MTVVGQGACKCTAGERGWLAAGDSVVQASDRRQGQIWVPKKLWGLWCHPVATGSSHSVCRAVEASDEARMVGCSA